MQNIDAERLLEKTVTELEVRATLNSLIKEHEDNERSFAEWESRLLEKEKSIEDSIINCDEMLRQADAKRECAEESAKRDVKMHDSCAHEMCRLRSQLTNIRSKISRVVKEVGSSAIYFEFLSRATRNTSSKDTSKSEDTYELVDEILDRHRTLVMANSQLQNRLVAATRSNGDLINVHNKYMDDSRELVLALNTRLGSMKRSLESNVRNTSADAIMMTHLAKKSTLRRASVSLVKMAAENIFTKCTGRSRVRRCASSDTSVTTARLRVIGHVLCDWREIINGVDAI